MKLPPFLYVNNCRIYSICKFVVFICGFIFNKFSSSVTPLLKKKCPNSTKSSNTKQYEINKLLLGAYPFVLCCQGPIQPSHTNHISPHACIDNFLHSGKLHGQHMGITRCQHLGCSVFDQVDFQFQFEQHHSMTRELQSGKYDISICSKPTTLHLRKRTNAINS